MAPVARVIVIGAGVAGLATAALLARDGHDVHVLERGSRVGGRAGRIDDAGFVFDTGPSWYLMPAQYDHFFRMLGTSAEAELDLRTLDPGYRVLHGPGAQGGPLSRVGPDDVESFDVPWGEPAARAAFEAREPGAGAALAEYLATARQALDLSLAAFLYNPFTSVQPFLDPEVRRAAPALARWLVTSLAGHAGRRFADPVLREVLSYPAVFLGVDPRRAPAIYHLMSQVDLSDGVRYPVGGFTGVVAALERLARTAGVRITLDATVDALAVTGRGRRGHVRGVEWTDVRGRAHRTPADVVVSTADLHHTETRLVPPTYRTYPERSWRRVTPGPSAVLVMLGVRGALPELPHHTLAFTQDWERSLDAVFGGGELPSPTSLYVCRPSATDDGVAPPGHENLFVLIPVSGDVGLGHGTGYPAPFVRDGAPSESESPDGERTDATIAPNASVGSDESTASDGSAGSAGSAGSTGARRADPRVERIADLAVEQIARWTGVTDLAERVVVRHTIGPADFADDYHSWRGGMLGPAHTLAQSAMFRRGPRSRRVRGLYYAGGTASPGVGVPMCLISAELVLKLVRGDASGGPLPEPAPAQSSEPGAGSSDRPAPGLASEPTREAGVEPDAGPPS